LGISPERFSDLPKVTQPTEDRTRTGIQTRQCLLLRGQGGQGPSYEGNLEIPQQSRGLLSTSFWVRGRGDTGKRRELTLKCGEAGQTQRAGAIWLAFAEGHGLWALRNDCSDFWETALQEETGTSQVLF
jgi:hypothetical protein